ncbi:hypothetical protein [uncultured Aquimarina sp.]|uniref:hypothetical protein n=1 Tax=uncultured Aquimarina sp. TaxID=575652 RepID=UPI00260ED5EC|nr:hypothetical protein [uncultured Aquimarina sp.]
MKKGMLSILVAISGFFLVFKYNALMHEIYYSLITGKQIRFVFIDDLVSFKRLFTIVTISFSLLSIYLGTISFLKKHKIGLTGIILAIILAISIFIPFWKYIVEDSGLDIMIN